MGWDSGLACTCRSGGWVSPGAVEAARMEVKRESGWRVGSGMPITHHTLTPSKRIP